eukprot:s659_g30.t1
MAGVARVETLKQLSMLAALSTEAVVLWDDVQKKIEDFNLQEALELTNGELQDAERILRRVRDRVIAQVQLEAAVATVAEAIKAAEFHFDF